ncbi:chitin synthase chs-2-like [Aulostomus maculatus]
MEEDTGIQKRPWDTCREVPVIKDEQTPWRLIKLLKVIVLCVVCILVFGFALCSKTSFLLLITVANKSTRILSTEQKPVALLCIGCSLIASSVLLIPQSIWKACYKKPKIPRRSTIALVMFFEFLVSLGAAILTIVAMPHLDIVTNVTILNGVGVLSALLQVTTQCCGKERGFFLLTSITACLLFLIGYILFVVLYIRKDPSDIKMAMWVGLAVGGSLLVSFNWWENYFRLMSVNSRSVFFKNFTKDVKKCQNILNILSGLLRIAVTACVLGAFVPLSKMDWDVVTAIPRQETRIIAIMIGVQLFSSLLCHWCSLAACKMHALRRCFIIPLYLASLAVMALLVVPVIVYYYDYRSSLNGTAAINFTGYCHNVVYGRDQNLNGSVFPHLVLDVTHTLCFLDMSKMLDIGMLTGEAVSLWLGLVLATIHLWHLNVLRIERTQNLFIRRLYEGSFIEQSLLLNTRFDFPIKRKKKNFKVFEPANVYVCATMWHETYDEMMNIIISLFRLDVYRSKNEPKFNDFTFEAHIYFDDAFKDVKGQEGRGLNEYAKNLVKVLTEVYVIFLNIDTKLFKKHRQVPDQIIMRTSYGGQLVFTMPEGNTIVVHFKDKDLIRHKKRWSQVMYLYYLLGWKLMTKYYKRWKKGEDEDEITAQVLNEKHNTYLLALDGDTDFHPTALMLLIDRLRIYPNVGAACGRIHPTGTGPTVWFQKFEYAVSHWLQKTAEHVFGCVLCSPGCFSLFRAEALMDDNVMKRYATKSMEASHYVQYDQGEDRWLCTLLLKQGWRIEYNAASDAYTNAPIDFKELFNQRRRWGPSTFANVVDILGDTTMISKRNSSMSKLFMIYLLFAITSAIMAPATICLMIAGSLAFVFNIHSSAALVIAVIPPIIYLILCFKLKPDTQIKVAAIFSIVYAFLMLVVIMSIIGTMVKEKTILTPSSIFVIAMAIIYITTAFMHPQEFSLVFHGFLYILCIPSAYLLLIIYSMVNMNNVSWGTREVKAPTETPKPAVSTPQTLTQRVKSEWARFIAWFKCCKKSNQPAMERRISVLISEPEQAQPEPQNTIVEDVRILQEEEERYFLKMEHSNLKSWVEALKTYSEDMHLHEDTLNEEEDMFWRELQEKYLEPLHYDKEKQDIIASDLQDLRNKINFVFFTLNALWLVATFTLQLFNATFSIQLPKFDLNMENTGENVQIDPIAFMFILGFALSVVIQFFAMLYHRVCTLIHYVAFLDTEPVEKKPEEPEYLPGKKSPASEYSASSVADSLSTNTSIGADDSWDESDDDIIEFVGQGEATSL